MTPTSTVRQSLVRPILASAIVLGLLWFLGCGGASTPSTPSSPPASSAPSASFTFSPASPVVSQSVQFSDSSTGNPTSWSWNFGDGGTSALQNPSHAYATAGTFTVTLTAGNASGSNATSRAVTCRADSPVAEVRLPMGEYDMGDHFGFVDPSHPSDEVPIHKVRVDSFFIATTPTTNEQYLAFLNDALAKRLVEVRNGIVYATGGSDIYYYTRQYASYYSIGFDGTAFSIAELARLERSLRRHGSLDIPVDDPRWFL